MDINTKFKDWIVIAPYTNFVMEEFNKPIKVAGKQCPENLNNITIGQLIELSALKNQGTAMYDICRIILGLSNEQTNEARAYDVVRFAGFVLAEVKRINQVFKNVTNNEPTAEQVRAGIKMLDFGLFGMLDWYARRMGIQDHAEVESVPWMRIYKCMDMDAKTQAYQERLQKVYADRIRTKN